MRALITGGTQRIASQSVDLTVSGVGGNLKFFNRACYDLLGCSAEKITGLIFLAVFSPPDQRGQSIERYLRLVDMDVFGKESMRVSGRSDFSSSNMQATCSLLPVDGHIVLVLQLDSAVLSGLYTRAISVLDTGEIAILGQCSLGPCYGVF